MCLNHSPLPALNETVVSASYRRLSLKLEELQLQEEEIRLKRKRLEYMKQLKANSRSVSQQPSTMDLMEFQRVKPKTDDNLRQLISNMSLLKLELEHFDGSPLNYHHFIRNFGSMVKSIGEDSQRLHYLLHCCEGSAKGTIRHCIMLPNDRGYAEALGILRARYGRPHHVLHLTG